MTSGGPADDPDRGAGASGGADPSDPSDPFADLSLDEAFVRAAAFREPTASERSGPPPSSPLPSSPPPSSPPPSFQDDRTRRLAPDGWDDDDLELGDLDPDDDEPLPRRHSAAVRAMAIVLVTAFVVTYLGVHLLTILR